MISSARRSRRRLARRVLGPVLISVLMLLPWTSAPAVGETVVPGVSPSPEGTWLVRVLFEGDLRIQFLQTFTRDGRTTLFLPFGGPVNAGDTRVACTGGPPRRPAQARSNRAAEGPGAGDQEDGPPPAFVTSPVVRPAAASDLGRLVRKGWTALSSQYRPN